uniref:rhodanese-like domain-containing protein n=1 Tax=Algoriphagus sp. TaxID=1872435 RepID=UPI004047E5D9
ESQNSSQYIAHQLDQLEKIKDEEIVIHCRSGARSGNAKKFMETKGFTQVRNVLGGILAFRALAE